MHDHEHSRPLVPAIDITVKETRYQIARTIEADIEDWSVERYKEEERKYLGGSIIGKNCPRMLWYHFRWFRKSSYGEGTKNSCGQILRLLNRGHREEVSIVEYLTGIGCQLEQKTQTEQKRISDCAGHFGGSLDNTGFLPSKFGITERIMFEFKTMNMNYFSRFSKKGVKVSHPEYWAQICTYGFKANIRYCLFLAVNKNNDEVRIVLLELDLTLGEKMIQKALYVITAREAPPKASLTETAFICKFCNFKSVCHHDETPQRNCRTCKYSVPILDGKWGCEKPGDILEIPDEVVKIGCQSYQVIPDNRHGF